MLLPGGNALERRRALAKLALRARAGVEEREVRAKKDGFASSVAKERAALHMQKKEAWRRQHVTWNRPLQAEGGFGKDGFAAYQIGRESLQSLLERAKLTGNKSSVPLAFLRDARVADPGNEETQMEIRHEVRLRLRQERERRQKELDDRICKLEAVQREQMEMRWEEYLSQMDTLRQHGVVDAESGLVKFYHSSATEVIGKAEKKYKPLIDKLHAAKQELAQQLQEEEDAAVEKEWARRRAARSYIIGCESHSLPQIRQVLMQLGGDTMALRGIGPLCRRHVGVLLAALAESGSSCSSLELTDMGLQKSQGFAGLCDNLESLDPWLGSLTRISLEHNGLDTGSTERVLEALGTSPQCQETLRVLSLANNKIGGEACTGNASLAKSLTRFMVVATRLEHLDLSHNPLSGVLWRGLARGVSQVAAREEPSLRQLSVAGCALSFASREVRRCVLQAFESAGVFLSRLDLSLTGLHDADMPQLVKMLQRPSCSLEQLYLSGNNGLSDMACSLLRDALAGNATLTSLRLEGCGYTTSGCVALLDILGRNLALQELEFDLSKCMHNPTVDKGPILDLLHLGLPRDLEFTAEVVDVLSWPEFSARVRADGQVHGWGSPPQLLGAEKEKDELLSAVLNSGTAVVDPESCEPGKRCLVQLYEAEHAPWFNVEVLETLSSLGADQKPVYRARVKLVDFIRRVDEDFEVYEPEVEFKDETFPVTEPYPVVRLEKLRSFPRDIAVLRIGRSERPKAQIAGPLVCFPRALLPAWMRAPASQGFVKSCFVSNLDQPGPVFELKAGSAGNAAYELVCPTLPKQCPSQLDFAIQWPCEGLAPRPDFEAGLPKRAPPTKRRSVYFCFSRFRQSATATLRMLVKQHA